MSEPEEPVGLRTRHIFLDTQVFRSFGHNPYSGPMRTLGSYINDGVFQLHTTDITKKEIQAQIAEMQNDLVVRANKIARQLERWNKRFSKHSSEIKVPEVIQIKDNPSPAYREFESLLLLEWSVSTHFAADVKAGPVFDRYFANEAPFDSAKSKEFPDAFVLHTLEQWCRQLDKLMYVVTKDKAIQRAAGASPFLIPISTLDELMSLVVSAGEHDVAQEAQEVLESELQIELADYLKEGINYVGSIYDGDKQDAEINHLGLVDLQSVDAITVLRVEGEEINCIVDVRIQVLADVSFVDLSDAIWDKEDGVYFGANSSSCEVEDVVSAKVFVELLRDDGAYQILSANFINRDLIITDYDNDDFGW